MGHSSSLLVVCLSLGMAGTCGMILDLISREERCKFYRRNYFCPFPVLIIGINHGNDAWMLQHLYLELSFSS